MFVGIGEIPFVGGGDFSGPVECGGVDDLLVNNFFESHHFY